MCCLLSKMDLSVLGSKSKKYLFLDYKMFKKPSNVKGMFNMSGNQQKKREPMPVFETRNTSVPVIRSEVEPAFTMGMNKKYQRSSGLEK